VDIDLMSKPNNKTSNANKASSVPQSQK